MESNGKSKLRGFIKKYKLEAFKDVAIFMAILLVFHFLWRTFIGDILEVAFIKDSANSLAVVVFNASQWALETMNINVSFFDELTIAGRPWKNVIYYAENNGFVAVNLSCSGLKQLYQWLFLMLLFPGPWKHKLWFIPMGLIVVHFVNVFRIISMTFVTINIPQQWDFMHDNVLRPFFYVVMFAMWVLWNEKFRTNKSKKTV
jgi:exosortase/archaeosortase family protein